ncbi:AT-rich interactive domain-containing protein 3C [Elgaria multicarinata webbii]|uniref:AT-rich interactive domain-containing protein 3C n=1 Tax=Elgaria multicarinata webbii TaxID=159646 RepID=UPI002FCD63AC
MGEHTRLAPKAALAASAFCSSASCSPGRGAGASGGLRLEAVMENLQRAQAARLEEKLRRAQEAGRRRCARRWRRAPPPPAGPTAPPLALRLFPAGGLPSARAPPPPPPPPPPARPLPDAADARRRAALRPEEEEGGGAQEEDDDDEEEDEEGEEEEEEEEEEGEGDEPERAEEGAAAAAPHHPPPPLRPAALASPPPPPAPQQPHEWTYEEQFKQLYELDSDPKRKEFLDDLFGFMQKRGTPVNRIPIMAKQVLDLYTLYRLVTEKGGLVEVINKKIWREITKGLNLPTSITSAAFTLRTQYMKYLYPYECDKRGLSSPGELQAAIDSNRREGRRQTFGTTLFNYSPVGTPVGVLPPPKIPIPSLTISTHNCSQISQVHAIKKEESILSSAVPGRIAIPVSLAGHHLVAAQAAASQAAALEQLREKLETGEPPEKKMALVAEEQQRLVQHALQQNLLAMASQFPVNIKINNRGDDRQEAALNLSTNGISSINMSIEINGVVYTGVLFARRSGITGGAGGAHSHISPVTSQSQLLSTASRGHTPASTSP